MHVGRHRGEWIWGGADVLVEMHTGLALGWPGKPVEEGGSDGHSRDALRSEKVGGRGRRQEARGPVGWLVPLSTQEVTGPAQLWQ